MSLLLMDQQQCRAIYEARFTLCCVFKRLGKNYQGVEGFEGVFEGVFTKTWLKQQFKDLLGVLPRMPLYKQTLQVQNVRGMILNDARLFVVTPDQIIVWDANTEAQIAARPMPGLDGVGGSDVRSIAVSDDKLFVGSFDGTVHVCKTSDYSHITTLSVFTEESYFQRAVSSLAVYNGMLFVGGGHYNGDIAVFNTNASPMTRMRSLGVHDDESEYEGHNCGVSCLKIHDGKLHSGGDDSIIKIWDCESFELLETLTEHSRVMGINSLAIYNDQLISGASSIRIWSCEDYSLIASICTGGPVRDLTIHDDILYVTSYYKTYMWDLSTYQRIDVAKLKHVELCTYRWRYRGIRVRRIASICDSWRSRGMYLICRGAESQSP